MPRRRSLGITKGPPGVQPSSIIGNGTIGSIMAASDDSVGQIWAPQIQGGWQQSKAYCRGDVGLTLLDVVGQNLHALIGDKGK